MNDDVTPAFFAAVVGTCILCLVLVALVIRGG